MTKKQGNALKPGIYKVHWKRGGWNWAAIGNVRNQLDDDRTIPYFLKHGMRPKLDREILSYNWSNALKGSRMWRKIAKVERAPLAKMEGER